MENHIIIVYHTNSKKESIADTAMKYVFDDSFYLMCGQYDVILEYEPGDEEYGPKYEKLAYNKAMKKIPIPFNLESGWRGLIVVKKRDGDAYEEEFIEEIKKHNEQDKK
jgi:hypothetical protein